MKAATDLAQALLQAARPAPIETNPFLASVKAGLASGEAVRRYATALANMAIAFPYRIASVLAICAHPEVRRSLLGNLMEEEGVVSYLPGSGVTIAIPRSHGTMARRLAIAAGATEQDVTGAVNDAPRWFREALLKRDWLGAFAYFSVGHEANVPAAFRILAPALTAHYGMAEEDLEFLIEHMSADERHGVEAAELIAQIIESEDEAERAMEGARRGGIAWWALHRSFAATSVQG
jgi:pyrroloquinoline quinone (PQQ) biosynthesis protein C